MGIEEFVARFVARIWVGIRSAFSPPKDNDKKGLGE